MTGSDGVAQSTLSVTDPALMNRDQITLANGLGSEAGLNVLDGGLVTGSRILIGSSGTAAASLSGVDPVTLVPSRLIASSELHVGQGNDAVGALSVSSGAVIGDS